MLIVRVELHSATTGEVTEIARMRIVNTGEGTATTGFYRGYALRGRGSRALDRGNVIREAHLVGHARQSLHVWHLVGRMLSALGYVSRAPAISQQFPRENHHG